MAARPIVTPDRILEQREALLRMTAPESFDQARERVINDNDILPLNFLSLGEKAAKSVVRVIVPQPDGRTFFGTGFMVSPRLMITNYHVFDERPATSGLAIKDLAADAMIEFDYALDDNGIPMDSTRFRLHPDEFLASSPPDVLDYTLVAVELTSIDEPTRSLPEFGYLKLIGITGKAATNEKLSSIHHPKGEFKAISIRDKKLTEFVDENFIQYEVDTERGSSGAPVFNDQWLVVALHHESVPERRDGAIINIDGTVHQPGEPDTKIHWIANKGIRVSAIINDLKKNAGEDTPLLIPVFNLNRLKNVSPKPAVTMAPESVVANPFTAPTLPANGQNGRAQPDGKRNLLNGLSGSGQPTAATGTTMQFTIPLEVSVKVGSIVSGTSGASGPGDNRSVIDKVPEPFEKTVAAPGSYADRNGYNPAFLTGQPISLDKLLAPVKTQLALTNDQKTVLTYRNFSVAINRNRRMAAATAVNIDGKRSQAQTRTDVWILDSRMNELFQTGPEVYSNNALDRGHMVRRLDPVWGNQAAQANNDTFHFTNSCPQHKNLNQKTWADLEDYILNSTKLEQLKVTVFTGPVFSEADIPYRGVLLPLQFWKVAAVVKKDGKLSVTAYLLSQKDLVTNLSENISEDGFGQYRTYQVPLTLVQSLTKLDFSPYFVNDPLNRATATRFEAATDLREVRETTDLIL
jgi:endonuclease G